MQPRVVVGTDGSPGCAGALHRAAAEARVRQAELWVVLAWQPPGGGLGSRHAPGLPVADGCRATAAERLLEALDSAFGTTGPGVASTGLIVRATPGAALVDSVRDAADLIVVGTGRRGLLQRALRPSVARYCLSHAPCPVLAVPPSPLRADLDAVRRRNAWRIPLDVRDLVR
ncbi:universal stress protein [Streptomyces bambusae]|uniref:universal stress protein n=1 Tax=Streptomyces bambusae TaxID=1550616 RepID=UPI001CFC5202|nr:universal stress protein [Streptomyces bambusae]MCB5164057.1 universal stress protein [Streptomyces bambusae]